MSTSVERAARALCEIDGQEPIGEAWDAALKEAHRFVRLFDIVTPKPPPDTSHLRRGESIGTFMRRHRAA